MLDIVTTKRFRKDLKRCKKRGKDMAKLQEVLRLLVSGEELDERYKPHPLLGDWSPSWDLHIEPDWLLIYQARDVDILLVRTGTHADLF